MDKYLNFNYNLFTGTKGGVEIKLIKNQYYLFINGHRWMTYDTISKNQVKEIISHVDLAEGDVITTGLGLGLREQLILSKKEVKSLTVIERSKELIDFHSQHSPWITNKKLSIIHADVTQFQGNCDVLLLDHYEQQNFIAILNNVYTVQKKINCKKIWFWPFEAYIIDYCKINNCDLLFGYTQLIKIYSLEKLPKLSLLQLSKYCSYYENAMAKSQLVYF